MRGWPVRVLAINKWVATVVVLARLETGYFFSYKPAVAVLL
jgi:hypothetical protein